MRARDDKADGSWGWSRFPFTISRIEREAIDKISHRGPRPEEIRLMKLLEKEAGRETRARVDSLLSAITAPVSLARARALVA